MKSIKNQGKKQNADNSMVPKPRLATDQYATLFTDVTKCAIVTQIKNISFKREFLTNASY